LEALSRGAAHCVFVERDEQVATVLRENIAGLGFPAEVFQVVVADYARMLPRLATQSQAGEGSGRFDLLFVDPPYRMLQEVEATLGPLLLALLADDGLVVVEGPRSVSANMGLNSVFDRTYGETRVVMLETRRTGP
jgi:16S rRNA (guanine966-N2)-methyltransferase